MLRMIFNVAVKNVWNAFKKNNQFGQVKHFKKKVHAILFEFQPLCKNKCLEYQVHPEQTEKYECAAGFLIAASCLGSTSGYVCVS